MPTLIFGVVVLVLVLWALNIISKVDPKIAARVMKLGGGLLALGLAVFLGLRGELGIAIPLGAMRARVAGLAAFRTGRLHGTHAEGRRADVARAVRLF